MSVLADLLALPNFMLKEIKDNLWEAFVEKERKNLEKKRKYLHFDLPVKFDKSILSDKEKFRTAFDKRFRSEFYKPGIFLQSFYPFIQYIKEIPRYKLDEQSGKRKLNYKPRPLCYASHKDALRLSWLATQLNFGYEKILAKANINKSILAYRKFEGGKSNIDFAFDAFEAIKKAGECVAICFDIEKFFQNISHQELKKQWIRILSEIEQEELNELPEDQFHAFRTLTNYSYVDKSDLDELFAGNRFNTNNERRICTPDDFRLQVRGAKLIKQNPKKLEKKGIPQGSAASAILANISMLSFDEKVWSKLNEIDCTYMRYSDDILVFGAEVHADQIQQIIKEELATIGLKTNDKEDIIFFRKSNGILKSYSQKNTIKKMQYLGFEFDGTHAFVRSSSLSRYHGKLRRAIQRTVKAAYQRKGEVKTIYKSKLLKRYIIGSEQNFISYANRAKTRNNLVPGNRIEGQLRKRYKILNAEIRRRKSKKM